MNTASAPEATDGEAPRARETLKALYGYVRPHRWAVALGLLLALVGSAGGLLQPLATKALVDRLSSGDTIATILLAMTLLVLLSTVPRRSVPTCWSGRRSRWSWPPAAASSAGCCGCGSRRWTGCSRAI